MTLDWDFRSVFMPVNLAVPFLEHVLLGMARQYRSIFHSNSSRREHLANADASKVFGNTAAA
jgi:hypothetical protein